MTRSLISEEYLRLNAELHRSPAKYGHRGKNHLAAVVGLWEQFEIRSTLDYGCGKAKLRDAIRESTGRQIACYDPAIPEFSELPKPADLVVCTDVLEHVEPDLIDNVLDHLQTLVKKVGFFVISLKLDETKTLPDGTNPHRLVRSPKWWTEKLSARFVLVESHPLSRVRPRKQMDIVVLAKDYPDGN
jgi:hypothetical protein